MTNHLPECPTLDHLPFVDEGWCEGPCICDRLRACEARLEDECVDKRNGAWTNGYKTGFLVGALRGEHGASTN